MNTTQHIAVSLAMVIVTVACGGARTDTRLSYQVDNDSDHTVTLDLDLSESSVSDDCESSHKSKLVTIGPRDSAEGELTMACGYEPRVNTDGKIVRNAAQGARRGFAYRSEVRLKSSLERITNVRIYMPGQAEPQDIPVTPGVYVETNGLPYGMRLTEAFVADFSEFQGPVARVRYLENAVAVVVVHHSQALNIESIGILNEKVSALDTAPRFGDEHAVIDGYKYVDAYDYEFGHEFRFHTSNDLVRVHCNDSGCKVD